MSKRFRECSLDQPFLLPPSLQEWLPEEHLARFVAEICEQLDLSAVYREYERRDGRGQAAYHPLMLTRLLLYGYCLGRVSSRQIEKATHEDVAFRYLAADQHPDHDTIANFRQQHLEALAALFGQGLELCRAAGLVKMGRIALDGTKIAAQASRRKSASYGKLERQEAAWQQTVAELLAEATRVDAEEDARYGQSRGGEELPAELSTAEKRLQRIRAAKAALEEAARTRAEAAERERQQQKASGQPASSAQKKRWQRAAAPLSECRAQYNFTDPDSRVMQDSGRGGFLQGYNAQAAVLENQVVVSCQVSTEAADKQQLVSMAQHIEQSLGGKPSALLADAGYWSEEALHDPALQGIDLFVAPDHCREDQPLKQNAPRSPTAAAMREKLRTEAGAAVYKLRQQTIEPVFGQIKEARRFRRFLLRGLEKVRAEWRLICLTHNLLKLFRHRLTAAH